MFKCDAIGDSGGYCDRANDALINKTLTSGNLHTCTPGRTTWHPAAGDLAAGRRLQLTEVASNLQGVNPQSPTLSINPEDWYFVK